ncbi:hypothetical protein K732_22939, partial [Salmonella enterica subsp. enterica serovar Saintpaul str. S-70]
KDYSSRVSIEKIDAFISKTNDIPGLNLIYATRTGYQSGAKIKQSNITFNCLLSEISKNKTGRMKMELHI